MPFASEIEPVSPGVLIWRFYDPSIKADLFSTVLETATGAYLIDPIPLAPEAVASFARRVKIAGIIVTNENHERAAAQFAEEFKVSVYVDAALASATGLPAVAVIQDLVADLTAVPIQGGPAGEIPI